MIRVSKAPSDQQAGHAASETAAGRLMQGGEGQERKERMRREGKRGVEKRGEEKSG